MTNIKNGMRVAARRASTKAKQQKKPISIERLLRLTQYARRPKG